ncbi:methyltransferase family protein [Xanthomonas translucens]|uniref:methyltransferase family protein n=1 Tax=Xanthomonas campestris pv. translucens TaxID=343 RepID=UPI002712166F|nr:methyltransferase [Xanthomonas translucens]WLA03977.1 isoprenylcysteine carboxylmethyltransferase family protein [Xanthomonas translucens]
MALLQLAGGVVAAAGLLLSLLCLARFVQRRTTVLPERDPSSLVVRGPYRYSRNPMYLSLLLSYVGLCVQIGWPWALLLLAAAAGAAAGADPVRGSALARERFGSAYARYCAQVRRWL